LPYEDAGRSLLCEFVGTLVLVTTGASTVICGRLLFGSNTIAEHGLVALTGSLVVSLAILLFGSVSGAFLNPAVTLSQAVSGWMPRRLLLPYVGVQVAAAVASGVFVRLVFGALGAPTEFGLPRLEEGTTVAVGIALEAGGTLIRCSSSLYSSFHLEKRPRAHAALVGIALFVPTVLVGPLTGAAFNPAMSLGPAVASMDFGNQYVYLLGAALGCAVAIMAFGTRRWKGRR